MPHPIVAIIGRPNVGKSTLFNRLLGRRQAIVSDVAGTTRDRLMAEVTWADRQLILVDTGGLEPNPQGEVREKVQEQAQMAMDDAHVIIFLTDVTEGLTPTDHMVADKLRRTQKPIILAVNKVDSDAREFVASEFYQLGMENTVLISAYHNFGIHDLMERVISYLPPLLPVSSTSEGETWGALPTGGGNADGEDIGQKVLNLAIIGRTNVGKSMLLNAILGQQRAIVSEVAGTTRDALDTNLSYNGYQVVLIDTAGIRRPGQVSPGIEKYSVIRSVNAVDRSDIALLVTDATELATAQDAHIAGLVWDMCRGLIVVVNKWDLVEPEFSSSFVREWENGRISLAMDRASQMVRERLHFMAYVPVCFTSALQIWGVDLLMQSALELWQERLKYVPFRKLQYVLAEALADHAPPTVKGRRQQRLSIHRVRQVGVNPPTFVFSVNHPELVHFSYQRYLENRLRTTLGFDHTHLKLVFQRLRPRDSEAINNR